MVLILTLPVLRITLTVLLSLTVFSTGSLGLNRGMVLCVDHHGHVAVEAAHAVHCHDHGHGDHHDADHDSHPDTPAHAPGDAVDAAAPDDCSDTTLAYQALRPASPGVLVDAPAAVVPPFLVNLPDPEPRLECVGTWSNDRPPAPPPLLEHLRSVVLLV